MPLTLRNAFEVANANTPAGKLGRDVMYYIDDFMDTSFTTATAGTGTFAVGGAEAAAPGVVNQSVTAVADRHAMCPNNTNGNPVTMVLFGAGQVTCEMRTRTPVAQDGVDQWTDRFGMLDVLSSFDATDGVYLEMDRALNGDNNVRLCASNNSIRTKTSLGVSVGANVFERWKIVVNALGTSAQAFKNDAAVGAAVTTNIPTAAGRVFAAYVFQLIKTLGANARLVHRDYAETYQEFSSPR